MAQVFISYAKKDYIAPDGSAVPGNFVDQVIDAFNREGITYWLDREQLGGGETYAERIARNIRNATSSCSCPRKRPMPPNGPGGRSARPSPKGNASSPSGWTTPRTTTP